MLIARIERVHLMRPEFLTDVANPTTGTGLVPPVDVLIGVSTPVLAGITPVGRCFIPARAGKGHTIVGLHMPSALTLGANLTPDVVCEHRLNSFRNQ